jgi:hypothetical protein
MDAFEQAVSEILYVEGYWVRQSVKVELTKKDKVAIGLPSSPRWELDVVAYSGCDNTLKVVECKSYIDSRGIAIRAFNGSDPRFGKRFKLFWNRKLRSVVFSRLRKQFVKSGRCRTNPKVQLCLACGRIASEADRKKLRKHFTAKRWELWDEHWLKERLEALSKGRYENQVSAVVSKLLLRGKAQ